MTDRQLLFVIIMIGVVTLGVVVEVADEHVTKQDIAAIVAFVAGGGFVLAMVRGGRK